MKPDEDRTRTLTAGKDPGAFYGVALTRKGNIAVYTQHVDGDFDPMFETYPSLEAAEQGGEPGDILTLASFAMGTDYAGYVRKLDI